MNAQKSLDRLLFGPIGPVGGQAAQDHTDDIQAGRLPGKVLVPGGGWRNVSQPEVYQRGCDCPLCRPRTFQTRYSNVSNRRQSAPTGDDSI